MKRWRHSWSNVDNSVRITAGDSAGMQRTIEYLARCPFSLARIVSRTKDGKILYRAAHPNPVLSAALACLPYPLSGDTSLLAGIPGNFEAAH